MVEAVGSVSASDAYQEFEKRNNRFVNMLTDNVKQPPLFKNANIG